MPRGLIGLRAEVAKPNGLLLESAADSGWLEDFRRIATKYEESATGFLAAVCLAATVMSPDPVMGPMMSSLPSDRHAAELTLLSEVSAEAATLCCQRGR